MKKDIIYKVAKSHDDFQRSKEIILEYVKTLDIDLAYMDLPTEFSTMELKYSSPQGVFILAFDGDIVAGCVGIRKIDQQIAELKRLYVRKAYRGLNIGSDLLQKALDVAQQLSYQKIRLEVIPSLQKAKKLYYSFGFNEIPPYFNNQVEGTTYMEKSINL